MPLRQVALLLLPGTRRDHTTGTQVLTTDAALAIIDALEQGETPGSMD